MHARPAAKPLALLAAVLLAVGVAACGDDGGTDAKSSDATSPKESEVTIVAKDFSLTSVTAKPGEDVYVDNQGSSTHTVTADDGSFDTGNVESGKEAELTAPSTAGTYAFHCSIHPNMTGTLTVA